MSFHKLFNFFLLWNFKNDLEPHINMNSLALWLMAFVGQLPRKSRERSARHPILIPRTKSLFCPALAALLKKVN